MRVGAGSSVVQHHNGVFRSTDGGENWQEVPRVPPSVFGFAVAVHPRDPNTAWFVPAIKDETRAPVDGRLVVARTRDGGKHLPNSRPACRSKTASTSSIATRSTSMPRAIVSHGFDDGQLMDQQKRWRSVDAIIKQLAADSRPAFCVKDEMPLLKRRQQREADASFDRRKRRQQRKTCSQNHIFFASCVCLCSISFCILPTTLAIQQHMRYITFLAAVCFTIRASVSAAEPCAIRVLEKGTGWPVSLVELRTTDNQRFVTDNAGIIALDAPR